jgi:hypothetical protein
LSIVPRRVASTVSSAPVTTLAIAPSRAIFTRRSGEASATIQASAGSAGRT